MNACRGEGALSTRSRPNLDYQLLQRDQSGYRPPYHNPTVQMSTSHSARIKRSKHYLMLINFIRYYVTLGLIEVRKVATEDNLADVLTKPLAWKDFAHKAAKLLGMEVESFEDIS